MDLLFIKLMLHLSLVKQMYSQTMHLTHELKLFIQITRRRVDYNIDSTVNDPSTALYFILAVIVVPTLNHPIRTRSQGPSGS